jgi:hypothetical protein
MFLFRNLIFSNFEKRLGDTPFSLKPNGIQRNNTWTLQQRIVPISLNVAWLDLFLSFKK